MELNDVFEEAVEKKEMLHCQLFVQGKLVEKPVWIGKRKPNCNRCKRRFRCLTMRAKRFKLIVTSEMWTIYEVFAESKDEARDIYFDWGDDNELIRAVKEDGDGGDMEIEEWNDDKI